MVASAATSCTCLELHPEPTEGHGAHEVFPVFHSAIYATAVDARQCRLSLYFAAAADGAPKPKCNAQCLAYAAAITNTTGPLGCASAVLRSSGQISLWSKFATAAATFGHDD